MKRPAYVEAPIPDKRLYDFPAFTPEGESLAWHFSFSGRHRPSAPVRPFHDSLRKAGC